MYNKSKIVFGSFGVRVHRDAKCGKVVCTNTSNIQPRGKIGVWSQKSRRRLRNFIFENSFPETEGTRLFVLTLTIPCQLDNDQERSIFKRYCERVSRNKEAAIWRLELTRKGRRHWHVIQCSERKLGLLWDDWISALDSIGCVYDVDGYFIGFLSRVEGAFKYAFYGEDITFENREQSLRYIMDHMSKSHQEAINKGRHWGVIGRSRFLKTIFTEVLVTKKNYYRIMRCLDRLSTASEKADCVFNSRLKKCYKRGRIGSYVGFWRHDTVNRLLEYYK